MNVKTLLNQMLFTVAFGTIIQGCLDQADPASSQKVKVDEVAARSAGGSFAVDNSAAPAAASAALEVIEPREEADEVYPLVKSMAFTSRLVQSCRVITSANAASCRLYLLGANAETVGSYEIADSGAVSLVLAKEGKTAHQWPDARDFAASAQEVRFSDAEGSWTAKRSLVFYGLGITLPESPSGDPLLHNATVEFAGLSNKVRKTYSAGWTNQGSALVELPYYNRETNYYAPGESNRPYHKIVRSSKTGEIVMASMGFPFLLRTPDSISNISFYREGARTSVRGYQNGIPYINDVGEASIQLRADGSIAEIQIKKPNQTVVFSFVEGSGKFTRVVR